MNTNLVAFLVVIRTGEGTLGPDGYRTMFGGKLFDSYADHPRQMQHAGGYSSDAAGAYQGLSTTWDDFIRAEGPHDFSPGSQDAFAVWCISRRGALEAVNQGDFDHAVSLCNREWASLPGSPYGQPTRTLAEARATYTQAGGVFMEPINPIGAQDDGADTSTAVSGGDSSVPAQTIGPDDIAAAEQSVRETAVR